ncbi:hypothetical protein BJ508DRAFT_39486 [Ascobolus immersus RN42]|uniref:Uncharacterized protein n=1 Tax=Ascobolus immersus RN42 TaxID=1160509 RepID=A0A3N4HLV9_ASCIM|nr:hypothetical protein BJ508DRAFT_39486 [Ascobolus immersus RN42]
MAYHRTVKSKSPEYDHSASVSSLDASPKRARMSASLDQSPTEVLRMRQRQTVEALRRTTSGTVDGDGAPTDKAKFEDGARSLFLQRKRVLEARARQLVRSRQHTLFRAIPGGYQPNLHLLLLAFPDKNWVSVVDYSTPFLTMIQTGLATRCTSVSRFSNSFRMAAWQYAVKEALSIHSPKYGNALPPLRKEQLKEWCQTGVSSRSATALRHCTPENIFALTRNHRLVKFEFTDCFQKLVTARQKVLGVDWDIAVLDAILSELKEQQRNRVLEALERDCHFLREFIEDPQDLVVVI